jgi:hypothetical protein
MGQIPAFPVRDEFLPPTKVDLQGLQDSRSLLQADEGATYLLQATDLLERTLMVEEPT